MLINKKNVIISLFFLPFVSNSTDYNIVIDKKNNNFLVSSQIKGVESSEWAYSEEYGCEGKLPLAIDYNEGILFDQNEICYQNKTRTHIEKETNSITGEILYTGVSYDETVVEQLIYDYSDIGTYKGTKCLDILNKGENKGSGLYLLSDNNSVFCEMFAGGGGFQLKRTKDYIPDGNMTDGTGINTEAGSNPENIIVSIQNPVSNYAIKQPEGITASHRVNEYEIHPDVCDMVAGDYLALTAWTDVENANIFHNRYYDYENTPSADGGSPDLINTEIVNGVTWYQYRYMKPIFSPSKNITPIVNYSSDSCHNWYVGYGAYKYVDQHITGFSLQVYTR